MTCPAEHRLPPDDPDLAVVRLTFVVTVLAILVLSRAGCLP